MILCTALVIQGFRGLHRHVQRVVDSFRHIIDSFSEMLNCSATDVDMFGDSIELSFVLFTPFAETCYFSFLDVLKLANSHSPSFFIDKGSTRGLAARARVVAVGLRTMR